MKKYDAIVFIGRFQPVHNAHVEILRRAAQLTNNVIVIIGSAHLPRTTKNPFTALERQDMLEKVTKDIRQEEPSCSFNFEFVGNNMYNDQAWVVEVQRIVDDNIFTDTDTKIGIIGHVKDDSSFYLKMFPQWEFVEQPLIEPLDATQIRELYFFNGKPNYNWFAGVLPESTISFMKIFSHTEEYKQLVREAEFLRNYKKQWEHSPYPPIFVTVDAVFIHSGHVLMIKRRAEPGKGLWALPGGFVDALHDRSIEDAMIRELKEETGIKLPEKVIRGSIKDTKVFDAIDRSHRSATTSKSFIEILLLLLARIP